MMDMVVGHDGHELTSMTSMTSMNHTQKAGLDLAVSPTHAIAWVVSRACVILAFSEPRSGGDSNFFLREASLSAYEAVVKLSSLQRIDFRYSWSHYSWSHYFFESPSGNLKSTV